MSIYNEVYFDKALSYIRDEVNDNFDKKTIVISSKVLERIASIFQMAGMNYFPSYRNVIDRVKEEYPEDVIEYRLASNHNFEIVYLRFEKS